MFWPLTLLWVFGGSLLIRLVNVSTTKTFFQPDEYFQALEPAHNLVFGYGYITWEWKQQLRSALHPLIYAGAYWVVKNVLPLRFEYMGVLIAPEIVSAVIAAVGDTFTFRLARSYTQNQQTATLAWALSIFSGWNWYVSTRSFSNNLELALTVAGLSFLPWHRFKLASVLVLSAFGFLSCLVRPTNSILWGFLGAHLLIKNFGNWSRILRLALSLAAVLALVVLVSALADRYFYRVWTFPALNFLEFNVVRNLLVFYGTAPWHFYLFQGLPVMLMGFLPVFVVSLWNNYQSVLVALTVYVTAAFSAIGHKEFRFLQPVYPVMLVLTAIQANSWRTRKWFSMACCLAVLLHVGAGYFFTRVNEVGEIDVIKFVRLEKSAVELVGFLTPCHSTPWHSMLHLPQLADNSWFLTCEPPLHLAHGNIDNVRAYRDELDRFFDDPQGFLDAKLGSPIEHADNWPSHVVVFEPMERVLDAYLNGSEFHQCERFFNSYFHWDPRRLGDIIVYCKAPHKNLL